MQSKATSRYISKDALKIAPQIPAFVGWVMHHWAGLILGLLVLGGAGLRLFILGKAHFIGDGDEALIGLMAKHITEGRFPVFTYGLPYMAATESYFIAPIYALFGVSETGMKIAPWLASCGLIILNYLLARRFFGNQLAGVLAATLTAFPPLYLTITGLRAWGNFIETLLLGDLLFLLAYYLVFEAKSTPAQNWKLWGCFGLVVGYSFYGYWLAAFYYLPIFFFIFLKDKLFFLRRPFWLFMAAFFVGSLPFWLYNLFNNWATFHFFFDSPPGQSGSGKVPALNVLQFFLTESLGLAIGSFNYWFTVNPVFGWALPLIYGSILAGWLVARWRGIAGWFRLSVRPARPVDMLLLFGLLSPLLYIISGVGNNAFALPGVDTTGRYLLPLMGIAPLLLGGGLAALPGLGQGLSYSWGWRLGASLAGAGLLLLLFCNLYLYRKADFGLTFQSPYYMSLRPPADNRPVIHYFKQEGIEYATCNHWVGNRLMLNAADALKCVDYYDLQQGGLERFPRLTAALLEPGRRIGFLLVNPSADPLPLEERLKALGVSYTRRDFAPYSVIIPRSRPVSPSEVLEALRFPY